MANDNRKTKQEMLLDYLTKNEFGKVHGITSLEAINLFGMTRLGAVIFNIKKMGYNVFTCRESSLDRYGNNVSFCRYRIVSSPEN